MVVFGISLVLAFVMGLAIQRGNACMVVAFDDLIYRRSAVRLSTIVSTWLMIPGGLALLYLMTGFTPEVKLFPVTVWSVVGGMLLGIGAVIGGACTGGVVARIGSGDYVFMLTIVGFAAGCLVAQAFGPAATVHAAAVPTTVAPQYPVAALVGLVIVLALNVRWLLKGRHEGWRDFLSDAWDPRTATIVIATVTLALVQIYGRPWGYAELLGDASRRALDGIVGGLALFAALVIGAIVGGRTCTRAKLTGPLKGRAIRCFVGGLIMGIGLIDDRWGLDALTKFAGQITAASVLVTMGVAWSVLYIPFGGIGTIVLDQASSILLTLALTVAVINAMNFVDGLDGLAAGLGLITALAIFLFSVGLLRDHGGDVLFYPPAVISVVLAGACLGFLPHNFHPAKIFMGDSGSMLVGLMLAAASTTAAGPISQSAYGVRDVFPLLSPFLLVVAVMFVPALDMLLAIVRRTRAGRSPFSPDKMHLHHRLLQIGHSHRRVVLVIYLWVGIVALGAASTIFFDPRYTGAVMLAAIGVAVVVTVIPLLRGDGDDLTTLSDSLYDRK